jgi:hypothetical protein
MDKMDAGLRILIVAENASAKFGGEAALPLHYFRVLTQRKVPVWLVVHERTRVELQSAYPGAISQSYVCFSKSISDKSHRPL